MAVFIAGPNASSFFVARVNLLIRAEFRYRKEYK